MHPRGSTGDLRGSSGSDLSADQVTAVAAAQVGDLCSSPSEWIVWQLVLQHPGTLSSLTNLIIALAVL